MAHLIDKDALIAEIEKIYNEDYKFLPSDLVECVQDFKDDLLMKLDTLEVKEVDIEKSISDWLFEGLPNDDEAIDYIKETAKHFFELGLNAKNKLNEKLK